MVAVVSLAIAAVLMGLYVRGGFRSLARGEDEVRRARLVRAAERELARLHGDRP